MQHENSLVAKERKMFDLPLISIKKTHFAGETEIYRSNLEDWLFIYLYSYKWDKK